MRIGGIVGALLAALTLAGCGEHRSRAIALRPRSKRLKVCAWLQCDRDSLASPGALARRFSERTSASYTIRGEAVAVDLPEAQTLFALLARPPIRLGRLAAPDMATASTTRAAQLALWHRRRDVTDDYPWW